MSRVKKNDRRVYTYQVVARRSDGWELTDSPYTADSLFATELAVRLLRPRARWPLDVRGCQPRYQGVYWRVRTQEPPQ